MREITAKLVSARFELSKNKGTPGVNFVFEDEADFKKHYTTLWLSEKAIANSEKTMTDTLGWNGSDDFSGVGVFNIGVEVILVLDNEEYNGKVFEKVKYINKLGEVKMSADTSSAEAQKALSALKAARLARRQNAADAPKFDTDDSIPF